jgi:hypothetical protein
VSYASPIHLRFGILCVLAYAALSYACEDPFTRPVTPSANQRGVIPYLYNDLAGYIATTWDPATSRSSSSFARGRCEPVHLRGGRTIAS